MQFFYVFTNLMLLKQRKQDKGILEKVMVIQLAGDVLSP